MKTVYIGALIGLLLPALLGLWALFLHLQGIDFLTDPQVVSVAACVALLLVLVGFFTGNLHRDFKEARSVDRSVVAAMKQSLDVEMARSARFKDELARRKVRMLELEMELAQVKEELSEVDIHLASGPLGKIEGPLPLRIRGDSLRGILLDLIEQSGLRAALLADEQGLLVEMSGGELDPESIAAVSSIVSDLSPTIRDLLPIREIHTFTVGDLSGMTLEIRYFNLLDTRCALTTLGLENSIHPDTAASAIEAIREKLSV